MPKKETWYKIVTDKRTVMLLAPNDKAAALDYYERFGRPENNKIKVKKW